jgi:N-acetyltransferase
MTFSTQPSLQNEHALLLPLTAADFDALYAVAADPAIWAQHPNPNRWQLADFTTYFEGALLSQGALKIIDRTSAQLAGSTRLYDYDADNRTILIGYTFVARRYWGTGLNLSVKALLLDYLFKYVDRVGFHIGAGNLRSQIAIGRLGAVKVAEEEIQYFGEAPKLNFCYEIEKDAWRRRAG